MKIYIELKRYIKFFGLIAVVLWAFSLHAFAITTSAKQAIVVDVNTGSVLFSKNEYEQTYPASMTKIMLAYIIFEQLKLGRISLDDKFLVTKKAWSMGGSRMFLPYGSKVAIRDLLKGLIIDSGNDAAIVLAQGMAGSESEFVKVMNSKAQTLGMHGTHYANASGWPNKNHYTTVSDLYLLSSSLIKKFPKLYKTFGKKSFTYNKIKQYNRNPLLRNYRYSDGIKTGHTEVSGYGLVGSAKKAGRRVIIVMNGLQSKAKRRTESLKLLNWGISAWINTLLFKKDQTVVKIKTWNGSPSLVSLSPEKDLFVTIPSYTLLNNSNMGIKLKFIGKSPLYAPIKKGTKVGTLQIINAKTNKVFSSVDLVTSQDVKHANIFKIFWQKIMYLIFG